MGEGTREWNREQGERAKTAQNSKMQKLESESEGAWLECSRALTVERFREA